MSGNGSSEEEPYGSDRSGDLLNGRYQLEEMVGAGGMGEVWRATDTLLSRPVAIKVLHPSHMADSVSRTRFRTEARITAGLSHPGIAQVYDYGEKDDSAFLVMELVPGEPLSAILKRQDHGLEAATTLDILAQSAHALGAAHSRGVVHRDIKPGNLLVTEDGTVKLTDFGIARGNESLALTQTGMVMGTAQYISPEQASGGTATHASDVYSLGVVAYECLAGGPPFTSDTPVALALAHVREIPPPLPSYVPEPVQELVDQMLAKSVDDRPGSAVEIAQRAQQLRASVVDGGDRAARAATAVLSLGGPGGTVTSTTNPSAAVRTGEMPGPSPEDDDTFSAKLASVVQRVRGWDRRVVIAVASVLVVTSVVAIWLLWDVGATTEVSSDPQPTVTPQPTVERDLSEDDEDEAEPAEVDPPAPPDQTQQQGVPDTTTEFEDFEQSPEPPLDESPENPDDLDENPNDNNNTDPEAPADDDGAGDTDTGE